MIHPSQDLFKWKRLIFLYNVKHIFIYYFISWVLLGKKKYPFLQTTRPFAKPPKLHTFKKSREKYKKIKTKKKKTVWVFKTKYTCMCLTKRKNQAISKSLKIERGKKVLLKNCQHDQKNSFGQSHCWLHVPKEMKSKIQRICKTLFISFFSTLENKIKKLKKYCICIRKLIVRLIEYWQKSFTQKTNL